MTVSSGRVNSGNCSGDSSVNDILVIMLKVIV
jgi:hypothetical protein